MTKEWKTIVLPAGKGLGPEERPLPRETIANWYNQCSLKYLSPIYDALHAKLLAREVIHVDEVPCQVLREKGREPEQKSYFWIYLTGSDELPGIVLYD